MDWKIVGISAAVSAIVWAFGKWAPKDKLVEWVSPRANAIGVAFSKVLLARLSVKAARRRVRSVRY